MTRTARSAALLALATGLVVVSGGAALADAPQKTAWFTALSAGPLTLPAPGAADGVLRVAGSGDEPTAYATLALSSTGSRGTLVLDVVAGSAVGTPELALCPTKEADWAAGPNQPFAAGPEYDCSTSSALGLVSDDGASVTFDLDSSLLPAPGTVSLAIAPLPEGTAPFQVDLTEPDFTPEAAEVAAEEPAAEPAPPAPEGGTGQAEAPPLDAGSLDAGPAPAPEPAVDVPVPAVAGIDDAPLDVGGAPEAEPLPAPETAGDTAQVPTAVLPPADLAAEEDDVADGPRLLALLTLVGVSAGAGYAAGQQRTAPRLLGGRARALPPGGAAPGGTLVVVDPAPGAQPRGIGRFSRLREAAPRRLR